jgi:ATP-dependent Clp protease ATP-binding subunit ClpB
MNLNTFTEKAREAVLAAQQLAETLSHPQIEPEHLLVALLEQPEGIAPAVLRKLNADPGDVARAMRAEINKGPQAYGGSQPGISPRLKLVADLAQAEAGRLKDEFVSTEHLLVAIAAKRAAPLPRASCRPAASRATPSSRRWAPCAARSA